MFRTLLAGILLSCASLQSAPATDDAPAFLFAYFVGNGEDGLHLAWSRDGLKWKPLNGGKSFLKPVVGNSRLLRDPCITQGPDGTFHMVWTDSWQSGTIGHASSRDLVNWSAQQAIPVMAGEPSATNCWAPEIVYDPALERFVLFWATTLPGKFTDTWFDGKNDNNHRIYATTTKDFRTFTPTALFFDPGFNVIDATILPVGGKFHLFFKDETRLPAPMKNIRLAVADKVMGPYVVQPEPLTPPGSWVEGPGALRVGDATFLYFDAYTRQHYRALRTRNGTDWEDVTPQLSLPPGVRHGTAFAVPANLLESLLARETKPPGAR